MRAHNFQDLTGIRYHSWLVIGPYEIRIKKNGKRASYWLCRCDCGTERYVLAGHLNHGSTRNCGCDLIRKMKKPAGESARTLLLCSYRSGAKRRNLSWGIADDLFDILTKSGCFYCGVPPAQVSKTGSGNGDYIYNGIDRVDNTLGYEPDNVAPCCKICNRAKDVMSLEDFLSWVGRIAYKHNL